MQKRPYMLGKIIKLRFKQLSRELIGIGLIRIIFLAGLLVFTIGFLFTVTSDYTNSFYITCISVFLLLIIQTKRQDKLFLKTNFDHYRLIYLVEYLLLTSPITACLIFHFQWIPLFTLLSAVCFIIHLDFQTKQRSLNTRIQKWIPAECFEWKGGIRQTFFILILLWVIGLFTSFFIGSVPIVLFILGIIPFSFYEKGEPYQMILAYEMGTTRFLFHKIKMQITLFSIISVPLIAAFMIFHYERWYIPVAEYFIFISLYVYLILTKYAFYEPNAKSPAAQVFVAIGVLCGIVPVFLPVVWLLSVRFYFRSLDTLNFYLNDYN